MILRQSFDRIGNITVYAGFALEKDELKLNQLGNRKNTGSEVLQI